MIGLSGSHRTGKGVLAKTYAEATGCYLIQGETHKTYERMGIHQRGEYDLKTELIIQREVLSDLEDLYAAARTPYFVTDTTPIDLAAQLYVSVKKAPLLPGQEESIEKFWMRCHKVSLEYLNLVALVQPIDTEVPGWVPPTAYMEHLNSVTLGLMLSRFEAEDPIHMILLKRHLVGLQQRVNTILEFSKSYFPSNILLNNTCSLM